MVKAILILLLIVLAGTGGLRLAIAHFSKDATRAGLIDGALQDCPDSPNCVSSTATRPAQSIDRFVATVNPEDSIGRIATLISSIPGASVVNQTDHYIHATFKTRVLGFIDDFEALRNDGSTDIQVRSASRLGHSDFGVNRKRIETIRKRLL